MARDAMPDPPPYQPGEDRAQASVDWEPPREVPVDSIVPEDWEPVSEVPEDTNR